jgi:ribose transport system substrate-binding protein
MPDDTLNAKRKEDVMIEQGVKKDKVRTQCMSRRKFIQGAGIGMASLGLGAVFTGRKPAAAAKHGSKGNLNRLGKEDLAPQAAAKGKKVIGYVAGCAQCAGTAVILEACKKEVDRRGWELHVSDVAGDYSKAPGLFETFMQAGVDMMVDSAIDPKMLGDIVAKANAKKIPMFVESDPWAPGFECSVNQNTFEMAQKQALWIATRLGGKGNVGIISFPAIQVVARREAVLRTILGQFPGIKVVETHTVNPAKAIDDARKAAEVWLLKHPKPGEIGAVWGGWDDPAVGAATAIDAAGRKDIFVIGNDAGVDVRELMRSGSSFDGDIWVDGASMAAELLHQMDRIVLGKKVESREFYVNQPLISPHLGNLPEKGKEPEPAGTYYVWPYRG